jgi:hypothetical protein
MADITNNIGECRETINFDSVLQITLKQDYLLYDFSLSYGNSFGCLALSEGEEISRDNYFLPSYYIPPKETFSQNKSKEINLTFILGVFVSKFCSAPCCDTGMAVGTKRSFVKGEISMTRIVTRPDGTQVTTGITEERLAEQLAELRSKVGEFLLNGTGSDSPLDFYGPMFDSLYTGGFAPSLLSLNLAKDAGENLGQKLLDKMSCYKAESLCIPCVQEPYDPYISMLDSTYKDPKETIFRNSSPIQWDTFETKDSREYNPRTEFERLKTQRMNQLPTI